MASEDALLDYLDAIEEVLEASNKTHLFSNKISVDKDRIMEIIAEIRFNLPKDIQKAKSLLRDYDKIIHEAESKAADIVFTAEEEAKHRISVNEVSRRANDQATEIIEQGRLYARKLRVGGYEHVEEKLKDAERILKEHMDALEEQHQRVMEFYQDLSDTLFENRQEIIARKNQS